ncbi:MAG: hypothetical protein Q9168_003088 [Polycauliona sp. 1 TL-2023]
MGPRTAASVKLHCDINHGRIVHLDRKEWSSFLKYISTKDFTPSKKVFHVMEALGYEFNGAVPPIHTFLVYTDLRFSRHNRDGDLHNRIRQIEGFAKAVVPPPNAPEERTAYFGRPHALDTVKYLTNRQIKDNLIQMGITHLTEVQQIVLRAPHRNVSRRTRRLPDIVSIFPPGVGKTVAYLLPAIMLLLEKEDDGSIYADQIINPLFSANARPKVLIICTITELVIEALEPALQITQGTPITVRAIYESSPVMDSVDVLEEGCHILAATPGRLEQMLNYDDGSMSEDRRRLITLKDIQLVIIDEAAELLDPQRQNDLANVLEAGPDLHLHSRWLFSRAMTEAERETLVRKYIPSYNKNNDAEQRFFRPKTWTPINDYIGPPGR